MLVRVRMKAVVCLVLSLLLMGAVASEAAVQKSGRERQKSGAKETLSALPEVTVTINEPFVNAFLDSIFTQLGTPKFPLTFSLGAERISRQASSISSAHARLGQNGCESAVTLERERNGVKTAVRFENEKIVAPLAFSGSYGAGMLGCLRFQGWAETNVRLEFDPQKQTLNARTEVLNIQLTGLPSMANTAVLGLVQTAIDKRFNPIEVLRAEQLSAVVSIKPAGGSLRLRAREVRPEIIAGALRLHIFYDFVRAE